MLNATDLSAENLTPTLWASACTPNRKWQNVSTFLTCTLITTSSAKSADVVRCAIAYRELYRTTESLFTTWTERAASAIPHDRVSRVWKKSMLIPRHETYTHLPPGAGPRPRPDRVQYSYCTITKSLRAAGAARNLQHCALPLALRLRTARQLLVHARECITALTRPR